MTPLRSIPLRERKDEARCGVGACPLPPTCAVRYAVGAHVVECNTGLCEAHSQTITRAQLFTQSMIKLMLSALYAHGVKPSVDEVKAEIMRGQIIMRVL